MNNISVYWTGCSTNLLDMCVSYTCVDVLGKVNTVVALIEQEQLEGSSEHNNTTPDVEPVGVKSKLSNVRKRWRTWVNAEDGCK